jgi:hypothetical protein
MKLDYKNGGEQNEAIKQILSAKNRFLESAISYT